MAAYYNEFDPFAAAWLRELIKNGLIADGEVDERSIEDVVPTDLDGFAQCHFFAGIGVWSLALRKSGWGDERPIWTGSCPCQPFSASGKGNGFADERHLWPAFFHLISQVKPSIVVGEQVAGADGLVWIDLVSDDMEGSGYAFGAVDTSAAGFGLPHKRQRLYWLATDTYGKRDARPVASGGFGEAGQGRSFGEMDLQSIVESPFAPGRCHPQPLLRSVDDGFAQAVGGLHAAGNAVTLNQARGFMQAVMEVV